jgi:hypothetical protein
VLKSEKDESDSLTDGTVNFVEAFVNEGWSEKGKHKWEGDRRIKATT